MNTTDRGMTTGYGVVLVGALGFLIGNFLPYVVPQGSPSLWELSQTSLADSFGAALNLFPGPAVLIWISILGIRAPRGWFVPTLVAVTIVWSLARIGGLIFSYAVWNVDMAIGYWLMVTCVVVVIVGTIVILVSFPREGAPTGPDAAPTQSS